METLKVQGKITYPCSQQTEFSKDHRQVSGQLYCMSHGKQSVGRQDSTKEGTVIQLWLGKSRRFLRDVV